MAAGPQIRLVRLATGCAATRSHRWIAVLNPRGDPLRHAVPTSLVDETTTVGAPERGSQRSFARKTDELNPIETTPKLLSVHLNLGWLMVTISNQEPIPCDRFRDSVSAVPHPIGTFTRGFAGHPAVILAGAARRLPASDGLHSGCSPDRVAVPPRLRGGKANLTEPVRIIGRSR